MTRLRLQKARQLLLHTDRGIAQIAFEVGYSEISLFYKSFLKKKGFLPSGENKEVESSCLIFTLSFNSVLRINRKVYGSHVFRIQERICRMQFTVISNINLK